MMNNALIKNELYLADFHDILNIKIITIFFYRLLIN